MLMTRILAGSILTAVFAAAPATAYDLVNGGFESGDFTGWMYSGNPASSPMTSVLARDPLNAGLQPPFDGVWDPAGGQWFAALWSTDSAGGGGARLSVTFSALAGQSIEFDYFYDYGDFNPFFDWARGDLTGPTASLELFAHNTSLANELASDTNIDWRHISAVLPENGSYTLTFETLDADGTFESILGVDNVVVVPAPASFLTLVAGAALARHRRRRIS